MQDQPNAGLLRPGTDMHFQRLHLRKCSASTTDRRGPDLHLSRFQQSSANPACRDQACGQKRCPACGRPKPVSDFYRTPKGKPSGYCKSCQKAISRRARHRRTAAIRALIALHPEEWRTALEITDDDTVSGGGSDVA